MKRLGVFLLPPGWEASPLQGYPQHFAGTQSCTWVERGNGRVKCLAQEHNTMSSAMPGPEPGPVNLESSTLSAPSQHDYKTSTSKDNVPPLTGIGVSTNFAAKNWNNLDRRVRELKSHPKNNIINCLVYCLSWLFTNNFKVSIKLIKDIVF